MSIFVLKIKCWKQYNLLLLGLYIFVSSTALTYFQYVRHCDVIIYQIRKVSDHLLCQTDTGYMYVRPLVWFKLLPDIAILFVNRKPTIGLRPGMPTVETSCFPWQQMHSMRGCLPLTLNRHICMTQTLLNPKKSKIFRKNTSLMTMTTTLGVGLGNADHNFYRYLTNQSAFYFSCAILRSYKVNMNQLK